MPSLSPTPSGKLGTRVKKGPVWIPGGRGGDGCRWGDGGGGCWEGPRGALRGSAAGRFVCCTCAWRWSLWPGSFASSCSRCPTWPTSWPSSSSSCWSVPSPAPSRPPLPEQAPGSLGIRGVWSREEAALGMGGGEARLPVIPLAASLHVLCPRPVGEVRGGSPVSPAGVLCVWGHSLWCVRAQAFPEHSGCPVYPLHLHHPGWLGGHLQ